MNTDVASVILLTLKIASGATLIIFVPSTLIGYLLARHSFPGKSIVSALIGLPLVLPPTAIGFLLLKLLAVDGPLGREVLGIDLDIILTWKGAVIAAACMSIPLVTRTARVTFEGIDPRLESMTRTLGFSRTQTFFRTTLPLARRGLISAVILGFTRAIGEYGATVTLAGSIPGQTQTIASAIFAAQRVGDDKQATFLMGIALVIGLLAILVSESLSQNPKALRYNI